MRAIILPAFALALGAGFFAAPQEAQARFSPEQVLERVAEQGDLAADLLLADPPDLPG